MPDDMLEHGREPRRVRRSAPDPADVWGPDPAPPSTGPDPAPPRRRGVLIGVAALVLLAGGVVATRDRDARPDARGTPAPSSTPSPATAGHGDPGPGSPTPPADQPEPVAAEPDVVFERSVDLDLPEAGRIGLRVLTGGYGEAAVVYDRASGRRTTLSTIRFAAAVEGGFVVQEADETASRSDPVRFADRNGRTLGIVDATDVIVGADRRSVVVFVYEDYSTMYLRRYNFAGRPIGPRIEPGFFGTLIADTPAGVIMRDDNDGGYRLVDETGGFEPLDLGNWAVANARWAVGVPCERGEVCGTLQVTDLRTRASRMVTLPGGYRRARMAIHGDRLAVLTPTDTVAVRILDLAADRWLPTDLDFPPEAGVSITWSGSGTYLVASVLSVNGRAVTAWRPGWRSWRIVTRGMPEGEFVAAM